MRRSVFAGIALAACACGVNVPVASGDVAGPRAPAPAVIPTLQVHEPSLHIHLDQPVTDAQMRSVPGIEGVQWALGAGRLTLTTRDGGESREVVVLAADPDVLRPLTPFETASESGVWDRLRRGDALVSHAAAAEHGWELGQTIALENEGVGISVFVGALASLGPVADIVITPNVGRQLGFTDPNFMVVSIESPELAQEAADRIVESLGGGKAAILADTQPSTAQAPREWVESFTYHDLEDGLIEMDSAWIKRWIVLVDLPLVGLTHCNRLIVPQLAGALNELATVAPHLIDPEQFAGCWVPRHIDWDIARGISMHAWGLAVDVNSLDNPEYEPPNMDPFVVDVFSRWGFEWGGDWDPPDGMHFELERLLEHTH